MQRVISISNPQLSAAPLGDRLDASINETSNDIGNLIGELVQRSLRVGVSDIGDSLSEFAEEQVDQAVQKQMSSITEAADAVAQSTAKLVVQQSVADLNQEIVDQKHALEAKIDEAKTLAIQGQDASEKKIQLLRERGKQTWQKFQSEFESFNQAYADLRDEHAKLSKEHADLVKQLSVLDQSRRQDAELAQQKYNDLIELTKRFEERVTVLEQPRGIKGLLAKLRGNKDSGGAQSPKSS
jgi:chromosome segregation ATPase